MATAAQAPNPSGAPIKKLDKTKPIRCLLDVRGIPLEKFRLARDGKKWRQPARHRSDLLFRLASYADPDGTLGKFSPSMQTLSEHFAERTLYRYLDDLRELKLLTWERAKHYHQRQYRIVISRDAEENHLPDEIRITCQIATNHLPVEQNHLPDRAKTPAIAAQDIRLPSEEPSKKDRPAKPQALSSKDSNPERQTVLKEYRPWLAMTWQRLNLTKRERDETCAAILSSNHDLSTLQKATHQILDDLDVVDSYAHAGNKLAAGIADKAEALTMQRERKRQFEAALTDAIAKGDERSFDAANENYRRFMGSINEWPRLFAFDRLAPEAMAASAAV